MSPRIVVKGVEFDGANSEEVRALDPNRILGPFGTVGQMVWLTVEPRGGFGHPKHVYVGYWVAKTERGDLRVFTPSDWQQFFVPSVHVVGTIPDGR